MEARLNTKKTVSMMLVEDEIDALQILNAILVVKYPNITLYTAINGEIALELFKTHQPDIVITDINMPEICGNQVADKIIETNSGAKLIAMTGKSCNLSSEKISPYFQRIIEKPVDFKELFTIIDQCIGELKQ
jgi:YesN/AraC family two-component response regulator